MPLVRMPEYWRKGWRSLPLGLVVVGGMRLQRYCQRQGRHSGLMVSHVLWNKIVGKQPKYR